MIEEKKDEGVGDPIKLLLKESLAWYREKVINNFSQILLRLLTVVDASISSDNFGGVTPFKV